MQLVILSVMAALLAGPAHVLDGDTLKIKGLPVRLYGIDAIEEAQVVEKPQYETVNQAKAFWLLFIICIEIITFLAFA